jgi:hypothetical protein
LRGQRGQIVATDGRQVLIQGGSQFPWEEDLLVPALAVLGCREFAPQEPIRVGKTDQWVALELGNWTLWLGINREGRFPKIDDIVAQVEHGASRLSLPPGDVEFLAAALPKLPNSADNYSPVTLDLNGQAVVRAKPEGQARTTELVLSNSQVSGDPVRIDTNRKFLARALKMGFTEIRVTSPTAPALGDDGRRQYIWALLDPTGALGPTDDAVRIESPPAGADGPVSQPKPPRRRFTMSENPNTTATSANGTAPTTGETPTNSQVRRSKTRKPGRANSASPIEQAVAVRNALRETVAKTNELIRAINRHKKQSRLVQSTLASLKQLQ